MRKRLVFIVIGLLILVGIVAIVQHKRQANAPKLGPPVTGCTGDMPSKAAAAAVVKNRNTNTDQSTTYVAQTISEPVRCWDVVTLQVGDAVEPQTAILQRVGNSVYVAAGPATSFPASLMERLAVPAAVQSAVVVYNDDASAGPSGQGQ